MENLKLMNSWSTRSSSSSVPGTKLFSVTAWASSAPTASSMDRTFSLSDTDAGLLSMPSLKPRETRQRSMLSASSRGTSANRYSVPSVRGGSTVLNSRPWITYLSME